MAAERPRTDIAQLVVEHHQAVYRYAYRLSGSVADAEDLTQQVFLAAQQKLDQLHSPEKARSWLFAVLRNEFLKGLRRGQRLGSPDPTLSIACIPAAVPCDEDIDRERLQQAINGLSPEYRAVVLMFYFEDLPYRAIADQLGIPIGTVMSRLARAKQALRGSLFEPHEAAHTSRLSGQRG
jgi:RNA polymerase sigma-70 factor (ECF subfamily)